MFRSMQTLDLTNRFYRNVDVESEVATKLLAEAIKRSMEEHKLYNTRVQFNKFEYDAIIQAIKYVFRVAKEQGSLGDKFLNACLSDNYSDITWTNNFQVTLSDLITHEFNITPHKATLLNGGYSTVRFFLPHGTQNQNTSIEKLLAAIETTVKKASEIRFTNYSDHADDRIIRLNYKSHILQDNIPGMEGFGGEPRARL